MVQPLRIVILKPSKYTTDGYEAIPLGLHAQ